MRYVIFVALLMIAPPAKSEPININGIARSVSLMFFIGEICSRFYSIDRQAVRDAAMAFAHMGDNVAGKKNFGPLTVSEISRREKEIKATGPEMWCTYQKANVKQFGTQFFID